MAGSGVIVRELERVMRLPFASPSGFVVLQSNSPQARDMLIVAQDQHRQVLDAIERREGSRAEAIMREHSRIAQRNLREAMQSHDLDRMPAVRLIRQPG
jgi:GntR family transcriptional regulator of vanillate catabolism